ncbi:S-layer homology domain-containing protein [Paenibacillus sp. P26]|nr:S-layer homology domain-containing protein [Paenibacillus sp. P26]
MRGTLRDGSLADLAGHWAKADVEWLVAQGLVNGTTETTFSPQNEITRAQFSALLVRALKGAGKRGGEIHRCEAGRLVRRHRRCGSEGRADRRLLGREL